MILGRVSVSIVGGKFGLMEASLRRLPIFRPIREGSVMAHSKPNVELNEDQEAEAQRIYERLRGAFD